MKVSERIPQGGFNLGDYESSEEKSSSYFWGVAMITSVFVVVIIALALLLL